MEHTFMTIHNANILYASDSIFEILGYAPQDVLGRSSFDFFHPEEVPFARSVHSRGVLLDKAAVLHYARLRSRDGQWVSCECCFTIVHDVLVACISIYRRDAKSERRAVEAPQVRRLFSRSPRDPRYHMLQHLSPKFKLPPVEREPRAALILNRFTRTLTVMFATDAIAEILGVPAEQVQHKSFYECIRESSLDDAFRCLESAKANDSIAYLRFWSRDPRRPEDFEDEESNVDEESTIHEADGVEVDGVQLNGVDRVGQDAHRPRNGNGGSPSRHQNGSGSGPSAPLERRRGESRRSSDSEGGGVKLDSSMDVDSNQRPGPSVKVESDVEMQDGITSTGETSGDSRTASSNAANSAEQVDGYQTPPTPPPPRQAEGNTPRSQRAQSRPARRLAPSVELEAVVSCTSDGLVVILRRARPQIPNMQPPNIPSTFDNGVFAAPWAQQPVHPRYPPEVLHEFQAPLVPQQMPLRSDAQAVGGPPMDHLMQSIRDVAVFAWALCGINGNLANYSHGQPQGESQPPDGLPVWDPTAEQSSYEGPENQAAQRWSREAQESQRQQPSFAQENSSSSDSSMGGTVYNSNGMGYQRDPANDYGNPWYSQPSASQQNQAAFANNHRHRNSVNYMDSTMFPPQHEWDDAQHWPRNPQAPSSSAEDPPNFTYRWY
ncbi:hypothetical protein F66182_2769 [Fusarium sp. NRRL 66182]|nr:hypothetical protein F66182_2769 [Fusarium sp. NRRL 66182]